MTQPQPRKRTILPPVYEREAIKPAHAKHAGGFDHVGPKSYPPQPARVPNPDAHTRAPTHTPAPAGSPVILPSLTVATSPGHPMAPTFGSLVAELAAGIETQETICARYNLSRAEFTSITAQPSFQAALVEAIREFQSISNTPNRVRMKAQLITELLLPAMHNLADNIGTPAAARVSAFSAVRSLTGLEKPEQTIAAQKFSLTINLDGSKPVTIEATGTRVEDDTDQPTPRVISPITQASHPPPRSNDVFAGEASLDMDIIEDADPPPSVPTPGWSRRPAPLP